MEFSELKYSLIFKVSLISKQSQGCLLTLAASFIAPYFFLGLGLHTCNAPIKGPSRMEFFLRALSATLCLIKGYISRKKKTFTLYYVKILMINNNYMKRNIYLLSWLLSQGKRTWQMALKAFAWKYLMSFLFIFCWLKVDMAILKGEWKIEQRLKRLFT